MITLIQGGNRRGECGVFVVVEGNLDAVVFVEGVVEVSILLVTPYNTEVQNVVSILIVEETALQAACTIGLELDKIDHMRVLEVTLP
jgi:hypothetical protein